MALWAHSTSCFRWPSLRSIPSAIRCAPGIGPRSGLFLIFINNLPDNIRSSVRLFADDCVLYRNIHSRQDCLTLQEDLTSLGQWEADWQMKFNVAKCHSMRVTRHQHHNQILFDYSLHNQTLENVQSAKYLGITITDNTSTYASPVWDPHTKDDIQKIESVQRQAARWRTLEQRRTDSRLILFYKIIYGYVAIPLPSYAIPLPRASRTSHPLAYRQISTRTDYYKYSFYPLTVVQWNSLPASIATLTDLDSFKRAVCQVCHSKP